MKKSNYVINASNDAKNLEPIAAGFTINDCKDQIDNGLNKNYKFIEIVYSPVNNTEIDKVIWMNKALEKARSRDLNESIDDSTIDNVEDFINYTKNKFPGSEAIFDGDKNIITITLDNVIKNESLDTYAFDETNKDDQELYNMIGQDIADIFATKYKISEFNDFNGENDEFDKAIDSLIKVYKSAKDSSNN